MPTLPQRSGIRFALSAATLLLGVSAVAPIAVLESQVVMGRVLERDSRRPVDGARVLLIDSATQARVVVRTDDEGRFGIPGPASAGYTLRAERIGYIPAVSDSFTLGVGDILEVEISLSEIPVAIQPVVVVGRRSGLPLVREFYARMDQRRKGGFGRFLTRDEILRMNAPSLSLLLRRVPRLVVHELGPDAGAEFSHTQLLMRVHGRLCSPLVALNGMPIEIEYVDPDDLLFPEEIEGIEVYRPIEAPGAYTDRNGCGSVLLWSHVPTVDPEGLSRWRHYLGGATAAVLGLLIWRSF